jgi:phosphoketolase
MTSDRCANIALSINTASQSVLGYHNRGGTLDAEGMLFANGCSWLHVLAAVAKLTGDNSADWLTTAERDALAARADPRPLLRTEENP